MRKKKEHKCVDCGAVGVFPDVLPVKELDGWLCVDCLTKRIHSPENMAITQANIDKDEFEEGGGKLS